MDGHVGESGDDLLLRREIRALLELKVANGSAQREVTVYSAKIDKATGCANASLLAFILRLVIEGKRLRAALDAKDGS